MIKAEIKSFSPPLACIGIALYCGNFRFVRSYKRKKRRAGDNPSITKQQAAESAAQPLLSERYEMHRSQTYVVYQSKKERSGYLQKEHLLEAYTKQYGERYPIDYYQVSVEDTKRTVNLKLKSTIRMRRYRLA